ncbi:hypothetical protein BO99DRAFT_482357 [Aspergillus violaceofuscus CBS 115571]|uniref:Uncharacterized protein n=1 Tax=Aspergillus violaceofuscus (strain CBS 115571) TaxID=1450538 RepID=A0A2V5H423_ASPV1|nr:hypothetical protein BO99DRAFT_482357 [Aspergillus violaceofuscus CBS 115571]
MPTLSGIYTSLTGQTLAVDEHCHLRVIHGDQPKSKLRADAEFWLCEDDGKIGKFGSPKKVTLHLQGQNYHIWVEPRGFSDGGYEFGLIPIEPDGQYSNRFLALNAAGDQLEILPSWSEAAKFRCVE